MKARLIMAGLLLAAMMPQVAQAQNVAAGETVFVRCKPCHQVQANKNGIGPSLFGVYGRKAGLAPGYKFSDNLKASGQTWTEEELDKFLTSPKGLIPGNKMVFAGLPDATNRKNLIAYLKTLK